MATALSTRRTGERVTLRDALGGRWATHWSVWLTLSPGTMVIVLVRESATTYPEWWWPLLSGVIEHLGAGAVLVVGGYLARRRRPILPIWTVATIWTVACLVRALVGGTIAEAVADAPADFLFRAVAWIVMTTAWIPAIVYGIAQVGRRRALIGELEEARRALDNSTARAAETGEEMRARLARTIQRSVAPVLDDLATRLMSVQQELDRAAFVEISMRLSTLHNETTDLIESVAARGPEGGESSRRASLREVFDVHLARPWVTAGAVTAQSLALVLPDGARLLGAPAAAEILLAVTGGGLTLGAVMRLCQSWKRTRYARASSVTFAAGGAAILVSAWILLHSGIDPVAWHRVVLLLAIGLGLLVASTVVIASLVLARANADDEKTLAALRGAAALRAQEHAAALERESHRLSELMHGPVQGRIAACVMALTFFADAEPGALTSMTEQVLEHLAAASHDLSLLAESSPKRESKMRDP